MNETHNLNSNIYKFQHAQNFDTYEQLFNWSNKNRGDFWDKAIKAIGIKFTQRYSQVLDLSHGITQPNWFVNAKLNITTSCFQAPPHKVAIIAQAANGTQQRITYAALQKLTNLVSNSLVKLGCKPGTVIAIDMIMTIEAVAIYLGIIQAGCVAVGIADSFAVEEVAKRITISKATLIFTQDTIARDTKVLPSYEKLLQVDLPQIIVIPRDSENINIKLRTQDLWWHDFLIADAEFTPIICDPNTPVNILFSSGTTGDPKAIVWDQTSPIKCAVDGYFYQDIQSYDVVCWPTSLGWMMGPWVLFATLINQATLALYYDVATTRKFTEFVADIGVTILGVVPSLVKAWRTHDSLAGVDLSKIKLFSSTGETSNSADMTFLMQSAGGKPIIEYCGGTEISGAYITSTLLQENIPAQFSTPTLGLDLRLLDEQGNEVELGEVALIGPSIGLSRVLLNRDNDTEYYDKMPKLTDGTVLRRHGDQMQRLANGYYKSLGRADDTMNLGGIKISSAEIEHCLLNIENVVEAVAIGKTTTDGPTELIVFAVVTNPHNVDLADLQQQMQHAISAKLNPLFKITAVKIIDAIPRTSSNKIMRRVLRDMS